MKSERLLEISKLVKENAIVADIGTDHGYIPVYLIENKVAKKVIGSDVSKGSLNKIISYVKSRKLEEFIDTRLGNGLEVIKPFEIDTVIIAGMGGILITEILEKDRNITNSINNFILQPMVGAKELREYLLDNGFTIITTKLLKEDGRYYEIINAKIGKEKKWTDINLELPQNLIEEKHPLLIEYINHKIDFSKNVLDGIRDKDGEKVKERVEELNKEIEAYEEVLRQVESK